MVGKRQDILVDYDYNNIIIVDPNKVVDEFGKAKDRTISQEDLVMYANLECKLLPRTKLALGVAQNDSVQTVSIAAINFLKPGGKEYMDNSYTDEITGKDSLKGQGINQSAYSSIKVPNKSNDYFIRQSIQSNGQPGAVDTGLLGITNISIRQNTSFTPQVSITLEDIKGRALFESGDNSPYAAFFNLPYPIFYLTIKGYLGKAVRLSLFLLKFNATYDTGSGNFRLTLDFTSYKYSVIAEIAMGHLLATPHMYKSSLSIQSTSGGASKFTSLDNTVVERGYQKIQEVYSEYKSKGLIPDDFPELTVMQMRDRLDAFIKNKMDTFTKQNMTPLSNVESYGETLKEYEEKVYLTQYGVKSWFYKYMDTKNYYVLTDGVTRVYTYDPSLDSNTKTTAIGELQGLLNEYNTKLNSNKTCGTGPDSGYSIGGKSPVKTSIPNDIKGVELFKIQVNARDVNYGETYRKRTGKEPTSGDVEDLIVELEKKNTFAAGTIKTKNFDIVLQKDYFVFEGTGRFYNLTKQMEIRRLEIKDKIETEITDLLANLLENKNSGVGFVPNMRNVLAVIFASGEAFLRLMDEVHTKAWELSSNSVRKSIVFNDEVASASQDNLGEGNNAPIYPWPQVLVATNGEEGQERYEIRYPGDLSLVSKTKGNDYTVWPEVEFVEEFVKGFVQRDIQKKEIGTTENEVLDVKRTTLNAIEFPVTNVLFSNKEEVKYFFEIYERLLFVSTYSKLSRINLENADVGFVTESLAEIEKINISNSLSSGDPYIIQKLKNYGFNSSNFLTILKQFSNGGTGQSWQNYIRGIFNTKYIKNIIDNSQFEFLSSSIFDQRGSQPQISITDEDKIKNFISNSTSTNIFDYSDTFPFTNLNWVKQNLANGNSISDVNSSFDTRKVLNYDITNKVITNYSDRKNTTSVRPITNFNYLGTVEEPNPLNSNNYIVLELFYRQRVNDFKKQLVTEGNIRYSNYNGVVGNNQTTSILNTPYFVNAILDGVTKFRNYDKYPFVSAAYLFLNSLPLATLKEKYKSYENNATVELDYIFATLKKFGAVHKVPYSWILKIGSIWHRYKKYIETGEDILNNSWKDFNSLGNYDPSTSASTKTYSLNFDGSFVDIVLQDTNVLSTTTSTIINTGFYPKLINDFNVFFQGYNIIETNNNINGVCSINGTSMTVSQVTGLPLQVGYIVVGSNIEPNTTIVSAPIGGGIGQYVVSVSQTVVSSSFSISNSPEDDYNSTNINNSLTSGLTINYVNDSIIQWTNGDTATTLNVRIVPWTVSVDTFDKKSMYLIPSCGSLINQAKFECISNNKLINPLISNPAIHNGSVRLFWTAPNYGYFDNSKLRKPTPSEYIKYIFSETSEQENFSINGDFKYSNIEEIFSIFDKDTLDKFENEFLNFSKSIYDYNDTLSSNSSTVTEKSMMNFQGFMREMMKLPKLTGDTGEQWVSVVQPQQLSSINGFIKQFLEYDVFFKFGNPSGYDRRIFSSFSNIPVTDPYNWQKYVLGTPNVLPVNGGTTSLSSSQILSPEAWKYLELYVGFSDIPELKYSNNGSYITDFFIDLNVAFTTDNIKGLSKIIKMYATQKLNKFQSNKISPPTPIPSTPPTIVALATLKNLSTISIYSLGNKRKSIYRSENNTVLFEGSYVVTDDNLKLINEVIIGAYGSLSNNPNDPQFIITIDEINPPSYDTIPNPQNKNGINAFFDGMTTFLNGINSFQGKIIDVLIPKLQKDLPNVSSSRVNLEFSQLTGEPQPKVELWESFKALNDKWIAGSDFKTKTLYEDIMLLDRASRNIGNKVIIDIFKLRDTLSTISPKVSMLNFVETILVENNFLVMNIPSYVNFYNVQEVVKNPKPRVDSTSDFANTLFGTFMNVDYRESTAKMVCFFGGKPSEVPDIKNVDFRYRSDAVDFKRTDNPFVENQINKNDHAISNKVVGFNVDIGTQNQSIFNSFNIGQNGGQSTAESLEILNQMANQAGNRGGSTQNVSLYNLYKNRSYTCSLTMIGNAMMQPTMYFNLRNVPMFNGAYMILEVNHNIAPGRFTTDIKGVRQSMAGLPKIDNYLQALRTNLVSKIQENIKQQKEAQTAKNPTNIKGLSDKGQELLATNANTITSTQTCKPIDYYSSYSVVSPTRNTINLIEIKKIIVSIVDKDVPSDKIRNASTLAYVIFSKLYLGSRSSTSNLLEAYGWNLGGIDLTQQWNTLLTYSNKTYYCSNNNTPYVVFDTLNKLIEFLYERWKPRIYAVVSIPPDNSDELFNFITKFVVENGFSDDAKGQAFYQTLVKDKTINDYNLVIRQGVDKYSQTP